MADHAAKASTGLTAPYAASLHATLCLLSSATEPQGGAGDCNAFAPPAGPPPPGAGPGVTTPCWCNAVPSTVVGTGAKQGRYHHASCPAPSSHNGWPPPPPVYPDWSYFDGTLGTSNEARDQFVELERELSDTLRTSIPARDQFVTQVILSTGHCGRDLFLEEVYRSLPNCDEDLLSQILLAFAKMKKRDSLHAAFASNTERKHNGWKRPRKPPRGQMSLTDSGDGASASSSHVGAVQRMNNCPCTGCLCCARRRGAAFSVKH